jgi:hypothetical protein
MKWFQLCLFGASLALAWSAAGWKAAAALFCLTWALNIARRRGKPI